MHFTLRTLKAFHHLRVVQRPPCLQLSQGSSSFRGFHHPKASFGEYPLIQLFSRSQAGCSSQTQVAGASFTLWPSQPVPTVGDKPLFPLFQHFQSKFSLSLPWVNSVQIVSLQDRKKKPTKNHKPLRKPKSCGDAQLKSFYQE